MRSWKGAVEIHAPIQVVWDTVTNFLDFAVWNPYVTKATIVTLKPLAKGAAFIHYREFRQVVLKIEEFIHEDYIRLNVKANRMVGTLEYHFERTVTGTCLNYILTMQLIGTDKLAGLFIGKIMNNELSALKCWLEETRKQKLV